MYFEHPDNNLACNLVLYNVQFELHSFHSGQALFKDTLTDQGMFLHA